MTDIARLAEEITAHGVTRLFGIPGSGVTLSLIDALEKRGIAFHLTHFEGAGALMAATVGRLSGRAGVSLSIKGPGLANAVPGIAAAWFEAYPLVHLTEAFPPNSSAAQAHKRLDQSALVAPITKASRFSAKDGPSFTSMAHFACAEEPGPVLFELAPSAPASAEALPDVATVREDGTKARELLRNAKQPIVIAGALALRAGLGAALAKLNVPVFSTAAAKGIIDERAPNAAGLFTGVGEGYVPEYTLLHRADLIIGIGLTARESLKCAPFKAPYLAIEAVETAGHRRLRARRAHRAWRCFRRARSHRGQELGPRRIARHPRPSAGAHGGRVPAGRGLRRHRSSFPTSRAHGDGHRLFLHHRRARLARGVGRPLPIVGAGPLHGNQLTDGDRCGAA